MSEVSPIYSLIKRWFEFSFTHPDIVRPVHVAIYMWHVELNNRMGWSDKFASPATQTMGACGIGSYNTYKVAFNDLVEWGFIIIIKKSENQHQSNIVALSKNDKSPDKSLDYALLNSDESLDISPDESLADHLTNHLKHNNTNIPLDQKTDKPKDIHPTELFPKPAIEKKIKKAGAVFFRESEFFDLEKFKSHFTGTKYEIYNIEYYYEAVLNWSEGKGEKRKDWPATARTFMLGDARNGKAVIAGKNLLSNNNSNNNGKSGFANNNAGQPGRYDDYKRELAAELGQPTS